MLNRNLSRALTFIRTSICRVWIKGGREIKQIYILSFKWLNRSINFIFSDMFCFLLQLIFKQTIKVMHYFYTYAIRYKVILCYMYRKSYEHDCILWFMATLFRCLFFFPHLCSFSGVFVFWFLFSLNCTRTIWFVKAIWLSAILFLNLALSSCFHGNFHISVHNPD